MATESNGLSALDEIPVVSDPVEDELDARKLTDYRDYKENLTDWLLNFGKIPEQAEGCTETGLLNEVGLPHEKSPNPVFEDQNLASTNRMTH